MHLSVRIGQYHTSVSYARTVQSNVGHLVGWLPFTNGMPRLEDLGSSRTYIRTTVKIHQAQVLFAIPLPCPVRPFMRHPLFAPLCPAVSLSLVHPARERRALVHEPFRARRQAHDSVTVRYGCLCPMQGFLLRLTFASFAAMLNINEPMSRSTETVSHTVYQREAETLLLGLGGCFFSFSFSSLWLPSPPGTLFSSLAMHRLSRKTYLSFIYGYPSLGRLTPLRSVRTLRATRAMFPFR